MIKEVTAIGKDVAEAQENARVLLGASETDDITYEVIQLNSKGIGGIIGVKPAKVKASIVVPDPVVEKKEKVEATKTSAPKKEHKDAPKIDLTVAPQQELHYEPITVSQGEDKAYDFVMNLLSNLGISDVQTEFLKCEDGTRKLNITGESASLLIGHHGETLDAVQYLVNLAATNKDETPNENEDKSRVTVDVEGYRAKREETLRKLARRMAQKALQRGSKVTLEPMTPYERRIIHSEIQTIEGVTTESTGTESNRRVVIYVERKDK